MDIKGIKNDPYSSRKTMDQNTMVNKAQEATTGKSTSDKSSLVRNGDEVNLSEDSKLMAEAYRSAMKTEDVRLEKIAEIKEKIDAGTYVIDSQQIAKNIISSELDLLK